MKNRLTKIISISLCVTTLLGSTAFIAPASATSVTELEQKISNSSSNIDISKIPKDHVYISTKTKLQVELTKALDSKNAHVGDPVKFKLLDNIIINDVVVIPAGTLANGSVTKARSAGGLGRNGKLEFSIDSIDTINNVQVPLTYSSSKSGQSDGGAVAVFAAVSIIGGLFMKGTNVQCAEGTKIEAVVANDTDLNVTFDNLVDTMSQSKPHGVSITLR